jgi:hypothetical protein
MDTPPRLRCDALLVHRLAALATLLATAGPASSARAEDPPRYVFEREDVPSANAGLLSHGIAVGDIDADGRVDIIEGGGQALLWYRNPDWTSAPIDGGHRFGAGAMVLATDVNRDGRLDVVTGRYPEGEPSARETRWYESSPSGWVPHLLSRSAFCHDVDFGDLDQDGLADMVCIDQFRHEVTWLKQPADPTQEWTEAVIDTRRGMGVKLADIDRDGRLDVVTGRGWYRNRPDGSWRRIALFTLANTPAPEFNDYSKVSVLDINGDGRLDVFAVIFAESREGRVYAFLAPPKPTIQPWEAVPVDPGPLWAVHSIGAFPFDGSSRIQIMVAEPNNAGFGFGANPAPDVLIYRLLGAPNDPASWERTRVDGYGTLEAQVADLGGDGLPEIIGHDAAPGEPGTTPPGKLSIWHNRTTPDPVSPPPARPTGCATAAPSLRCACDQEMLADCPASVPSAAWKRLLRACHLLDRAAADVGPARAVRLRAAARRLVWWAARCATRSARQGRITRACADAFARLSLDQIRPPRRRPPRGAR